MEYNFLGKTNLKVSKLGLGTIPLRLLPFQKAVDLIHHSLDQGINFIDTDPTYQTTEEKIGEVLKTRRNEVVLADKINFFDSKNAEKELHESLKKLRTEKIDLIQFHNISWKKQFEQITTQNGAYEFLQRAKKQGKVDHIGFSSHNSKNTPEFINSDLFETIQFSFNIVEAEAQKEIFPLANEKNMGIIIMKPLAGGMLINKRASIRYIFSYDLISSVLCGMASVEEVDQNIGAAKDKSLLSEEEIILLDQEKNILGKNFCHRCDYCWGQCKQELNIPEILTYCNGLRLRETPLEKRKYLGILLPNFFTKNNPENCIGCGNCMEKCPYDLDIPKLMKEAVIEFKKCLQK